MKYIISLLTISSLVVLAGCSSDPASVNANAGMTETLNQNKNTEVVVANANDNVNANSNTTQANTNTLGTELELSENTNNTEVDLSLAEEDTSDWLTYENDIHGFSVSYPSDWRVETGRDENNEPILDDIDTGFFVTYSLPAWKHQDFTPGISIVFETNENFSELKKRLEKNNQGSIETKIDGYNTTTYNQLEIVYEQITLVPKKNIIIRTRVDENYLMGGIFKGIYSSIQLD